MLKLECDILLSTSAVKFNLRRYIKGHKAVVKALIQVGPARYCSPRHRMPFNSINKGSKCVG